MPTVYITGAAGGIGVALAHAFAAQGYSAVLQYHQNKEKAESLQKELTEQFPVSVRTVCADISDPDQVERMFKECGGADVLVNNAAIAPPACLTADLSVQQWQRVIDVNLNGTFYCTQCAVRSMMFTGGRIINISSVWGVCGGACETAYSASKAGIIGMTRALARELGSCGITVNCIAPGVIDTPMNAHLSPQELAELAQRTPLGRIGTPQEVAAVAVFLASAEARFITGQVLGVDGGFVG